MQQAQFLRSLGLGLEQPHPYQTFGNQSERFALTGPTADARFAQSNLDALVRHYSEQQQMLYAGSNGVGMCSNERESQMLKPGIEGRTEHEAGERAFSAALWHSKPDFVSLLNQRFSDLPDEADMGNDCAEGTQKESELLPPGQLPQAQPSKSAASNDASDSSSEEESEEENMLECKARGRHQFQAVGLRISKIEKVLAKRKDLTQQQRRRLQSRKNTANFRERQKNTIKLKLFINYEIDAIVNQVSAPSLAYPQRLAAPQIFWAALQTSERPFWPQFSIRFLNFNLLIAASTWGRNLP